MDIYATREELKSRQKNIFDLKLNVAYYARVSTDKEEQKTSIEHQWTFFEQLISDVKNWTLVDGYIDEGISGITVTHREEFQRMLQDAKAGKIDLIITKEITRFARNVLDSIIYTRENKNIKVTVADAEKNADLFTKYEVEDGNQGVVVACDEKSKILTSSDFYTYDYSSYEQIDTTEQTLTFNVLIKGKNNVNNATL